MSDQSTKFFIANAPSEEFFIMAIKTQSWSLTQKAADRIFNLKNEENQPLIVFASIANSNGIQGAFRILSANLEPASEKWLRVYPGPQKYQVKIQWLSLFGGVD